MNNARLFCLFEFTKTVEYVLVHVRNILLNIHRLRNENIGKFKHIFKSISTYLTGKIGKTVNVGVSNAMHIPVFYTRNASCF